MSKRKALAAVLAAVIGGGTAIAVWQLRSGGKTHAALQTVTAARGDVLVTVGGAGRVVEGNATAQVAVPTSGTGSSGGAAAASVTASADSVFPSASGHVARILVVPGQRVAAGQPLAVLDDGGATALAVAQAENDIAAARLELAQKRVSDPAKGLPASARELAAAQLAVKVARQKLALAVARPQLADVTAARLEQRKARVDLQNSLRPPNLTALDATKLAIDLATKKLEQASGPPSAIDLASAQLELKKAQADLETLTRPAPGPSSAAVSAAQLAIKLAQQKLGALPATASASERTQAELELQKAQADLEALKASPPGPGAAAIAAVQAAIELANQKLGALTAPPNPIVITAAQHDLKKAQADLETLTRGATFLAISTSKLAVRLANERLARLLQPPKPAIRSSARFDVQKALADLETLRKRGAPASPTDISLAELKVQAAQGRLTLAQAQAGRLTVHAPAAGTVTGVLAAPGGPADATTPIATVANLQHLAVRADLSEFDAARVHSGLRALVSVDALGGRTLRGRVLFAAPVGVDNGGVVSFPVRIGLARLARGLRPGMNVSVKIVVASRRNVVEVPLEAVSQGIVTVLDAKGRTAERRVVVGLADNKNVEIRRGLRAGERVVIGGAGGGA